MTKKKNQKPTTKSLPHPTQPIGWDGKGVIRFKRNALVDHLLTCASEGRKYDLNDIVRDAHASKFAPAIWSREDYEQLMQLVGYSVCGFGELPLARRRVVDAAYDRMNKLSRAADRAERMPRDLNPRQKRGAL